MGRPGYPGAFRRKVLDLFDQWVLVGGPLVRASEHGVDLDAEFGLGSVGSVVDVRAVSVPDHEYVDVVPGEPGVPFLAVGPGAEGQYTLRPGECELLGDHGLWAERQLEKSSQGRRRAVLKVGTDEAVTTLVAGVEQVGVDETLGFTVQGRQRYIEAPGQLVMLYSASGCWSSQVRRSA